MVGQIPHIADRELLEYYMDGSIGNPGGPRASKIAAGSSDWKREESVQNPFLSLQPALPNVNMAKDQPSVAKPGMV